MSVPCETMAFPPHLVAWASVRVGHHPSRLIAPVLRKKLLNQSAGRADSM
jgi:hypothetical protein